MRRVRSIKKRNNRKNSTRRMQRGAGLFDSMFNAAESVGTAAKTAASAVKTAATSTAKAAKTAAIEGARTLAPERVAMIEAARAKAALEEPKMAMGQRMAGFSTLGTLAYVANRMEDKIDFLMQKEGLDKQRESIDAYWKRSQQGYFNKKQLQEANLQEANLQEANL